MKKLTAAIIEPSVIAIGSSIFLYSYNNKLDWSDYFLHLPFWIAVVRPSGLYWQKSFLKEINKGVFPPEMKIYREMYVSSKNAVLYDIILNHCLYHTILTPLLLTYLYIMKSWVVNANIISKEQENSNKTNHNSLSSILKNSFLVLLHGRALISCVSVLSEYLITYIFLKKQKNQLVYSLSSNAKRVLLMKQMILSWSWSGLILKQFFRNFSSQNIKSETLN